MRLTRLILPGLLAGCFCGTAGAADWLQWGYDQTHTGNNVDETTISADNVAQLTRRYQTTISSNANVAPVFASAIETPAPDARRVRARAGRSARAVAVALVGDVMWASQGRIGGQVRASGPVDRWTGVAAVTGGACGAVVTVREPTVARPAARGATSNFTGVVRPTA